MLIILFNNLKKDYRLLCELYFSKAFNKVPHSRLLLKLQHYGIRGHLHDCITSFLFGRTQCVVLDDQSSAATTVSSGVPQGTVLGHLLFLFFINDLPYVVSSTTRLFADDCLLYRRMRTTEDQAILQRDLDNLQQWKNNWLMRFNPDKCVVLIGTNKKSPIHSEYTIHGQVLNQTDPVKYLKSLSWEAGIATLIRSTIRRTLP